MALLCSKRVSIALLSAAAAASMATSVQAQCVAGWLSPDSLPTVDTDDPGNGLEVDSMFVWDPDGSGPLAPVLVVSGLFTLAGSTPAQNIAYWDGTTWTAFGAGLSGDDQGSPGSALAFTVLNGDLIAGGNFVSSGATALNHVARWDRTSQTWQPLGDGFNEQVGSLAVLGDGTLVAGGSFTASGDITINRLARWNGSIWSAFGTGITGASSVNDMLIMPNSDLIIGGKFTAVNGVSASGIARYVPSTDTWSALGTGVIVSGTGVNCLTYLHNTATNNDDIIAGGGFTSAGGVAGTLHIARYDGTHWNALGKGLKGPGIIVGVAGSALSMTKLANGDLIVGGSFIAAGNVSNGDTPAAYIARWNGSTWAALSTDEPLDAGNTVALATLSSTTFAVGGGFEFIGETDQPRLAEWADCPAVVSGICCRGSICDTTLTTQTACNAAINPAGLWSSLGTSCNSDTNYATPCCSADYDKNNVVNVNDIFAFLRGWFAHSSFANANQTGAVDVNDIFAFLRAWFATNGHCSTN